MEFKRNIKKVRAIAFYLPQFHPIPENDAWWGKGFTEWTNVAKAKPLFKGHKQPKLPSDLGFYDLRVPEIREQQANMAMEAGIEGFCYWHYWFGNGKRLLEGPFNEVLSTGKPDFPFCLAWANETWSGIWHGAKDKILIKQEYPGIDDYTDHFNEILPAFKDKRYILVDEKPLFVVYRPTDIPNIKEFSSIFNKMAINNGFKGIHLVGIHVPFNWQPKEYGFDAVSFALHGGIVLYSKTFLYRLKRIIFRKKMLFQFYKLLTNKPILNYKYKNAMRYFIYEKKTDSVYYPTIISGWDNTPRSGQNGIVYTDYNPDIFALHIRQALSKTDELDNKIVFIKSWNEWAEGNYLEPDSEYGKSYLQVFKNELEKHNSII